MSQTDPRVNVEVFLTTLWGSTALAALFVILRLAIRLRASQKIQIEDQFVLAAWLMLAGSAMLWQIHHSAMYDQFDVIAGFLIPTPSKLVAQDEFQKSQATLILAYYSCLWAVKISYLCFLRKIVHAHWVLWWMILAVTVVSWLSCLSDVHYWLFANTLGYMSSKCDLSETIQLSQPTLMYNCAIDVITNLLIMVIPATIVYHTKLLWSKKTTLTGLATLVVVVIGLAITRVSLTPEAFEQPDVSWLYLWGNVQMATAIVVVCIASFQKLYVEDEDTNLACFRFPYDLDNKLALAKRYITMSSYDVESTAALLQKKPIQFDHESQEY